MKSLNTETLQFLQKFDLAGRYERLLEEYPVLNPMESVLPDQVRKVLARVGYPNASYFDDEDFFVLSDSLKISSKNGLVEFIVSFQNGPITIAGNFGFVVYLYSKKPMFKKPSFTSYEQLEEILQRGLEIYDDLEQAPFFGT